MNETQTNASLSITGNDGWLYYWGQFFCSLLPLNEKTFLHGVSEIFNHRTYK